MGITETLNSQRGCVAHLNGTCVPPTVELPPVCLRAACCSSSDTIRHDGPQPHPPCLPLSAHPPCSLPRPPNTPVHSRAACCSSDTAMPRSSINRLEMCEK